MKQSPVFQPLDSETRCVIDTRTAALDRLNGKALGGRTNERIHALLYLARSHAMLGSALTGGAAVA